MKSSHQCRLCGRWLEGEWNAEFSGQRRGDVLDNLQRQMGRGACDDCFKKWRDEQGGQ